MTGEELVWYKIADRLKMSPSEAKAKHSLTHFRRWQQFFEQEVNDFHREDHITARVAYEVYQLRAALCAIFKVKLPEKEVIDFITKFEFKQEVNLEVMTDEVREEKLKDFCKASQAKWFGSLGLDSAGKPVKGDNGKPPQPHQPANAEEGTSNVKITTKTPQTPAQQKIRGNRVIRPKR